MPSVVTESARTSARGQTMSSNSHSENDQRHPAAALEKLERHILMDGFRIVIDHEKSRGSYLL